MTERLGELSAKAKALQTGQGSLDFGLWSTQQRTGASVNYSHRWTDVWYGFAEGDAYYDHPSRDFGYSAVLGFGAVF